MSELSAVTRADLGVQVFEQLKKQIVEGTWAPGTKIPSENELTRQLQVSRIVVRESIQKLIALGLVRSSRGEGTFVEKVTADVYMQPLVPLLVLEPSDIVDVLEYRLLVEPAAAKLACDRASDSDLETLTGALDHCIQSKNDYVQFARADLQFHLSIAVASHNPIIVKTFSVIRDVMGTVMADILTRQGISNAIGEHRRMLAAFHARDGEKVSMLLDSHLRKTIARFRKKGISE